MREMSETTMDGFEPCSCDEALALRAEVDAGEEVEL